MTLAEYTKTASLEEIRLLSKKLNTWLGIYTYEVRKYALSQIDQILSDPTTLYLLDELHARAEREQEEATNDIYWFLNYGHEYNQKNNVLTHSGSYRDVLYDRYLKDRRDQSDES